MSELCSHLDQIRPVSLSSDGCLQCLEMGDKWVHLRVCMICGRVGCCDASINKHASKHYQATGHPIMRSLEQGEWWGWCYIDQIVLELD